MTRPEVCATGCAYGYDVGVPGDGGPDGCGNCDHYVERPKSFEAGLKAAFMTGVMYGMRSAVAEPTGITTMAGMEAERERAYETWRRAWAGLDRLTCPRCGGDLEMTAVKDQVWCPTCKETGEIQEPIDLGDGLEAYRQEREGHWPEPERCRTSFGRGDVSVRCDLPEGHPALHQSAGFRWESR